MLLKYDINIPDDMIIYRLQNLINQIYKLLPIREEKSDWIKPLETILEELAGMQRLMNCGYSQYFFPLLNKLEGLFCLIDEDDFSCYRRIIFECLSLMNSFKEEILCLQNC